MAERARPMTLVERWGSQVFLLFAVTCLPISIFVPNSPNITFSALGVLSLIFLIINGESDRLIPPLKGALPFLVFIGWALATCMWSPQPSTSLANVGKITMALIASAAFYSAQREALYQQFIPRFTFGFYCALFLLIMDEILNTRILRMIRGPSADTVEYYHGLTIMIIALWPVMNALSNRHMASRALIITLVAVAVFQMTDHAAKLALFAGLVTWAITYISPKVFLRAAAILTAIIMLGFPFALKHMDPVAVIQDYPSLLLKPSYQHRLFILKRTTDLIFEQPIIGHGIDAFRSTSDIRTDEQVIAELERLKNPGNNQAVDFELLGEASHPHNLSLQLWFELGAIGVILYALFISTLLWRLSTITDRRYQLSTFNAMYATIFVIGHISFGAWQTWWLFAVSILAALALWQTIRQGR
jgi:O-antigen ligase